MDIENQQWDLADQELNQWLNGFTHKRQIPLSEILKSTFLWFRKKQVERISQLCNQPFENFKKTEFYEYETNFSLINEVQLEYGSKTEIVKKENERIIESIISNNQQIFKDLYELEFPKVVKLIINNSGSIDMAKDVFQDALIIFIEKVYSHKLDLTCSATTYLFSICRYLWLDQLRQNKREIPLKDIFPFIDADVAIARVENTPDIYERVNTAIESLSDESKQLLEYFYYKGMNWDEIAIKLGYANAASARNQKYKCLERLRSKVNIEFE